MLVLEKVYVNPVFSTSPVQAVLMGFLYEGTGTRLLANSLGLLQNVDWRAKEEKIGYNAMRSQLAAERVAESTTVFPAYSQFCHDNARERTD